MFWILKRHGIKVETKEIDDDWFEERSEGKLPKELKEVRFFE